MSKPNRPRPVVLMILDGYGFSPAQEGNAIRAANQPNLTKYLQEYPSAAIDASSIEAGLPWGEMGNSETGHQSMGTGRLVYQPLPKINTAIEDGSLFTNPILLKAVEHIEKTDGAVLHCIGLLSNGGVHSHIDHQMALLDFAKQQKISDRVVIHSFLDGRDSPPESAGNFVNQLLKKMKKTKVGTLATMIGRYYAMDRNKNWERTKQAYDLLVHGTGETFTSVTDALQNAFKAEVRKSFEIAPPMVISPEGEAPRTIRDGDAVVFYNYRSDRAIQLTEAFVDPDFSEFEVERFSNLFFVTMMPYADDLPNETIFTKPAVKEPLGEVLAKHKLKQLRIAESEKFVHVTYFFDGGHAVAYPGKDEVSIPSQNVKDYSTKPEMSAKEITDYVIEAIKRDTYDVIIVNYANPDMIAHTGDYAATVIALEKLDVQIGRVVDLATAAGGAVLITGDHGNAEEVVNQITHERSVDHTSNPVPVIYVTKDNRQEKPKSPAKLEEMQGMPIGILADIAPTVLEIVQIKPPPTMTAVSLLTSLQ